MRRFAALAAVGFLLAGCLGQTAEKQADKLGSIAAEGALVAHDAARGSTTGAFTRVHSRALSKEAEEVGRHAQKPSLAPLADKIDEALQRLADDPGDRDLAAEIERELEQAAAVANKLEEGA